jgi:catechol 2,3-dioxygenase-like lactoylglutathione lyase family enzyme
MITITQTNVTIMVKDMNTSVAFYESIGFKIKQRWGDHYAMLETTGLTIGLHPANEPVVPNTQISIGLMIEKCDEAKALLDKLNIKYTKHDDPNSGLYLHFNGPDGETIYFNEPNW